MRERAAHISGSSFEDLVVAHLSGLIQTSLLLLFINGSSNNVLSIDNTRLMFLE